MKSLTRFSDTKANKSATIFTQTIWSERFGIFIKIQKPVRFITSAEAGTAIVRFSKPLKLLRKKPINRFFTTSPTRHAKAIIFGG